MQIIFGYRFVVEIYKYNKLDDAESAWSEPKTMQQHFIESVISGQIIIGVCALCVCECNMHCLEQVIRAKRAMGQMFQIQKNTENSIIWNNFMVQYESF